VPLLVLGLNVEYATEVFSRADFFEKRYRRRHDNCNSMVLTQRRKSISSQVVSDVAVAAKSKKNLGHLIFCLSEN
jgi:hypothetical protein